MDDSFEKTLTIITVILVLAFSFGTPTLRWIIVGTIVLSILLFALSIYFGNLILKRQEEKAKVIAEKYPYAFEKYRREHNRKIHFSDWVLKDRKEFFSWEEKEWELLQQEEEKRIALEKTRIEQINEKYRSIESAAPNGLNNWISKNNFCLSSKVMKHEIKHLPETNSKGQKIITKEDVIINKDIILQYEEANRQREKFNEWSSAQKQFSHEIITFFKEELYFLGRYVYSVPVELVDDEFNKVEKRVNIWQLFFDIYCTEEGLDYTYFSKVKSLGDSLSGRSDSVDWTPPIDYIKLTRIISFIGETLSKKDIGVIIYEDKRLSELIDKHMDAIFDFDKDSENENKSTISPVEEYVVNSLLFTVCSHYSYEDLITGKVPHKKILIITALLKTEEIIDLAKQIWERFPEARPELCFLSIFKDYNREEMQALIDKKNKAIAEEEEKKRKEQELIDSIPSKVERWETLSPFCKLKIKYLLDYYPTTVEFEADDDEWDDRWTVWIFKNDPGKTPEEAHQRVLNRVVPKFAGLLKDTFGEESLKYLTLVCIPASTDEKNNARYKEFSERLCQETGIENGFSHIHLTRDRVAKREGGNADDVSIANYSFDDSFFNGKRVILLDDIITKGNSMRIAKAKLEKLGAQVICGLSVGKTRHERRNGRPDMDEE